MTLIFGIPLAISTVMLSPAGLGDVARGIMMMSFAGLFILPIIGWMTFAITALTDRAALVPLWLGGSVLVATVIACRSKRCPASRARQHCSKNCALRNHLRRFSQKLKIMGNHLGIEKKAYAIASGYSPSVFTKFADEARALGWPVESLPTHHFVMLSMPRETATVLMRHAA